MKKRIVAVLVMTLMILSSVVVTLPTEVMAATGTVTRIHGSDAYNTSIKVADQLKKELKVAQFDAIVIATSKHYADSLSGAPLAGLVNAPILMVTDKKLSGASNYIKSNLKKGGTLYILGGTAAVSSKFDTILSPEEYTVTRLEGFNMYGTNLSILKEIDRINEEKGKTSDKLLICNGKSYADSLATGAVGTPMLMVKTSLTNEQKEYLASKGKTSMTIIGGTAAVNTTVANQLKTYATGTIARCYGQTMYDTAVEVAKKFFGTKPKGIIVATGKSYHDGIVAGPLAQKRGWPIVLVSDTYLAQGYNYQVTAGKPNTTIIGGTAAVATKAAAPSNLFKSGWNTYGDNYIVINSKGMVTTYKFTDKNYAITPTAGGMIKKAAYTEVSRRNDSAGYGTAIVVHITKQKLDYVKNGAVLFSTDVTTGMDETPTPLGTFSVVSKLRNITMTGVNHRGTPYARPCSYWMGFIGSSHGIHDAPWRSAFGGTIYKKNGSLGCINVPKERMGTLFSMVSVGTKVVVKKG